MQEKEILTELNDILDARVLELAERLVSPGPRCSNVSASECHEISDAIVEACALLHNRKP